MVNLIEALDISSAATDTASGPIICKILYSAAKHRSTVFYKCSIGLKRMFLFVFLKFNLNFNLNHIAFVYMMPIMPHSVA